MSEEQPRYSYDVAAIGGVWGNFTAFLVASGICALVLVGQRMPKFYAGLVCGGGIIALAMGIASVFGARFIKKNLAQPPAFWVALERRRRRRGNRIMAIYLSVSVPLALAASVLGGDGLAVTGFLVAFDGVAAMTLYLGIRNDR